MSKLFGQLHFYYVLSLPKIVLWWNFQFVWARVVQINGAGTDKKKLKMQVDRLLNRHFCSIQTIQLKYLPHFNCNKVCWWSKFSKCMVTKNWFKDPGPNPKSKIVIFALSSCRMSQMKDCTFNIKTRPNKPLKKQILFISPQARQRSNNSENPWKKWIDITTRLLRGVTSNLRD